MPQLPRSSWSSEYEEALRALQGAGLSPSALDALRRLVVRVERYRTGDVVPGYRAQGRPVLVLAGWGCEARTLANGRRQIFDLLLAGDVAVCRPAGDGQPYQVCALTRLVALDLQEVLGGAPSSVSAELREGLAERLRAREASRYDQLARLRHASADERLVSLLLALHRRLRDAGATQGDSFRLPLTQAQLADALGLSAVHVNRTVKRLRRLGLVEMGYGAVRFLGPDALDVLRRGQPG
jgi:CRP-like cAMP-binding protein